VTKCALRCLVVLQYGAYLYASLLRLTQYDVYVYASLVSVTQYGAYVYASLVGLTGRRLVEAPWDAKGVPLAGYAIMSRVGPPALYYLFCPFGNQVVALSLV